MIINKSVYPYMLRLSPPPGGGQKNKPASLAWTQEKPYIDARMRVY